MPRAATPLVLALALLGCERLAGDVPREFSQPQPPTAPVSATAPAPSPAADAQAFVSRAAEPPN